LIAQISLAGDMADLALHPEEDPAFVREKRRAENKERALEVREVGCTYAR